MEAIETVAMAVIRIRWTNESEAKSQWRWKNDADLSQTSTKESMLLE
jgi:hypothetical protein